MILLGSAIHALPVMAQLRAFGEAEGFGAAATGGRGGTIYHVTNLNDSGAGSFRDAVSASNRIVVFDVGGNIPLSSTVSVASNITIAGQTAPGGGIQLTGHELSLGSQSNIIVRHIRVRPGDAAPTGDNGIGLYRTTNAILDHVSVEFAPWNNIDAVDDNHTGAQLTVQNSLIANPIFQQFVAHTESVDGAFTWSNNLLVNSHNRTPMAKVDTVFKNNVAYNYQGGYTVSSTATDFKHDFVNNYYIAGPSVSAATSSVLYAFDGGGTQTVYSANNIYDGNQDGSLNGSTYNPSGSSLATSATPWSTITSNLPTISAAAAYNYAIAHAGASLTRDELDALVVSQVQTLGNAPAGWTAGTAGPDGNLYNHQSETGLSNGGFGSIAFSSRAAGFDTDNDGIADTWEASHGLSTASASDSLALNPLGYRMIEQYFNELGDTRESRSWTGSGDWSTNTANWTGATVPTAMEIVTLTGNGVTNAAVTVTGGTASANALKIGGAGPVAGDSLTVSGGKLDVYDAITVGELNNATLNITGGTVEASNIQLGNTVYSPASTSFNAVLNLSGGTLLVGQIARGAGTAGNWNGGGTVNYSGGLLRAFGQMNITAPMVISSSGGTFDTAGNNGTISGAISGPAALTKVGVGSLNLTGTNSFTGGAMLRAGALGIGSDSNIGGATSAITFLGGSLRINGTSLTNIDSHAVNWGSLSGGFEIADPTHTFNVNSTVTGTSQIVKDGPGILQLNSNNNYTGGTFLKAGALAISSTNNVGGIGKSITFQGGSLRVLGTAMTNLDSLAVNWSSFNGGFDIVDSTNTFVINQVIGGSGGLTKSGAGTLVLNAANTFTGNTIINAGAIRMGHPLALQLSTLNFPTSGGGILDLNGYSLSIGNIAGNGGFDLKGGTLTVGSNNLSTVFTGVISDSIGGGKLVKVGTGSLTLTGNSSSNLGIIVDDGGIGFQSNIAASGASPFGTASAGIVLDGGTLARTSSAGASWSRLFTIGAGGGTLEGVAGYVSFTSTGTVPMTGAGDRTLTLSTGTQQDDQSTFKLVDPASGKLSVTKIGSGRWILSTASAQAWTYSGDTTITGGTLLINSASNVLPYGAGKGNLVISGGRLDLNGKSLNINALNGGGTLYSRGTTTSTVTLGNGDATGTFSGVIDEIAGGTINIVKTGLGVQVFSGANTYVGTTVINAGVLRFQQASSIGGSGASVTVNDGGIAAAGYAMDQAFLGRIATTSAGAVALAANSANALSLASYPSLELGAVGAATFTGTLTPAGTNYRLGNGTGTLTLPNANAVTGARTLTVFAGGTINLSGSNDYTSATTINNGAALIVGTLSAGGTASSIGSSSAAATNLIIDGGLLKTVSAGLFTDRLFTMTANGATLESSGNGGVSWNGPGAVAQSGTGNRTLILTGTSLANNLNLDLTDPSSGKTSLTKADSGRWFLGGNVKIYTGDTVINGGTLHTSSAVLPSGAGKGNVIVSAGTLNLGNNTTSINGLTGAGIVDQGGTNTRSLNLGNGDANGTFSGTLSGSGVFSVNKNGNGTQILSGTLSFGGNLTNNAGTLIVSKFPAATINTNGGLLRQSARASTNDPAGVSIIPDLNINSGSVDLTNNGLIIDYSAASPASEVRGWLSTGSLNSSTAAGSLSIGYSEVSVIGTNHFVGVTTDSTALILETAIIGDLNLDTAVNSIDFNSFVTGYGATSGALWTDGDLNYDGKVSTIDFNLLAGNFGSVMPAPVLQSSLGAVVPEPSVIGMISVVSTLALRRRRA